MVLWAAMLCKGHEDLVGNLNKDLNTMPRQRLESQRRSDSAVSPESSSSSFDPTSLHRALPPPRASLLPQQARKLGCAIPQQSSGRRNQAPNRPSPVRRPAKSSSVTAGNKSVSSQFRGARRQNDGQVTVGRKSLSNATIVQGDDATPEVAKLPMDLLSQCLTSLESVYQLVTCASVCRSWRQALLSDMVWKALYLRWWNGAPEDHFDGHERRSSAAVLRCLPGGQDSWRSAFIGRYEEGKRKILIQEKAFATRAGFLHVRRATDKHGSRVFDCMPGEAMQKLAELLGLTFRVSLNRGRQIKLRGKREVAMFPSSCLLQYPASSIGANFKLSALKSVEVTVTSEKLLRSCVVVSFTGDPTWKWEIVSTTSRSPGPMRLLQQHVSSGVSFMAGTLIEEVYCTYSADGFPGQEQVLLFAVSLHLSDLLWKIMDLGVGSSSRIARRVVRDDLDPYYGLHSWHASLQFRTFRRVIWSRDFVQVCWNPGESISGEKAVFNLITSDDVFPGVLRLPWKGEAFSGALDGVFMLDFTLWDEGGEIAWQQSSAVRIDPAVLAVVEYGHPDGERVQTFIGNGDNGLIVSINMCIPFRESAVPRWNALVNKPLVVLTSLQISLTSKFLEAWFGVANI